MQQHGVGCNKESPEILIDGDIIAHMVASASDGKYYVIDGIEGKYELIADVKKAFEKAGLEYDRSLVHEHYDPDPIEHCLHSVRVMTESIIEGAGNGPFKIFLSGRNNFRKKIATIQKYKGNRDDSRKPAHLQECREYLIRRWNAIVTEGEEADDQLGINQSENTIIASTDKDLDMIAGLHYRFPIFGNPGFLYEVEEVEANRNFYKQLLVGDTTDNIQGVPGIGAKNKAMKDLDAIEDEREMAVYCFDKYLEYEMSVHCDKELPEVKRLAYSKYLENARLLWIRREEGQIWTPPRKEE